MIEIKKEKQDNDCEISKRRFQKDASLAREYSSIFKTDFAHKWKTCIIESDSDLKCAISDE